MQARPSRRRLLRGAAAIAAGALASGALPTPWGAGIRPARAQSAGRVVVVGAGLAGLTAAWELRKGGVAVDVLEALPRVGGRTWTLRDNWFGGQYAEAGADFVDPAYANFLSLLAEFGLALEPIAAGRGGFYLNGIYRPGNDLSVYGSAVERSQQRLRQAVVQLAGLVEDPSLPWESPDAGMLDPRNLAAWLQEQQPHTVVKRYYEMLWTSLYGTPPEGLNLLQYARDQRLALDPPEGTAARVQGGADQLARSIGLALGERLRLPVTVTALEQTDAGVRVTYDEHGGARTLDADYAILALPPPALRALTFSPALSEAKRSGVAQMAMGHAVKVLLQYRGRFWRDTSVSGSLITDLPVQRVFDATATQGGERGILACSVGGAQATRLASLSPQTRVQACAQAIEQVYGGSTLFERGQSVVWDDAPTAGGGVSYYSPGTMTVLGPVVALPEGLLHFCGEHTDAWQGTLEGAVRSGRRAAAEVLRRRAGADLAPWLVARQLAEHARALGGE
jgi:monoamine oxidase